MTKFGSSLESFLLFTGIQQQGNDLNRILQELPDYTSPPNAGALAATPELYRSDEIVQEARDLDAAGNCTSMTLVDGNRCQIPFPVDETKFEEDNPKVGVVFYNGGLVDPRGYSPIAEILNHRYGIPVVMPIFANDLAFVFGVCDSGRLDLAKEEFPNVEKWVLAGHSFGGVAASVDMWSRWNDEMDDSAAGLVLLAADIQQTLGCGAFDFSNSSLPMAQLLASNDGILNETRVALNANFNSNSTFDMTIQGANHQSFGDYDSSERFELLGQVDGEVLFPDNIAWDLTAAAIAQVAARTGVPLPTPKKEESEASTTNINHNFSGDDNFETVDRCPPNIATGKSGGESSSSSSSTTLQLAAATIASLALPFLVFGWN